MAKDSTATTAVQVALRIRPLSDRDRNQPRFAKIANDDVLKIHDKTVQVVPQNKLFTFDHVFGTTSTQEEIFAALGDNLIRKFIEGYNITILAYGQTSSGKTYTMGTAAANGNGMNSLDQGIVPRSMALLFDLLNGNNNDDASNRPLSPTTSISSSTCASSKSGSRLRPKSRIVNRSSHIPQVNHQPKTKFTVKVSFIEIYNEDLHDLLNDAPTDELPLITIREDTKGRIYWTGVKEVVVHGTDDVLYHLEQGTRHRATGATDMNEKSSRSHAIFSVSLKQEKWIPATTTTTTTADSPKKARSASSLSMRSTTPVSNSRLFNAAQSSQQEDGEWLITTSKFHFVDLAGSERLKRTAAEGDRRKEGININAGLLALGNVISALGDPSKKNAHVPYRDSKLTRLLQDSLGGSATTLMIACASPVEYNLAETLNTLQYANRARNIKNRSEKNQVEEWMTTENIELLRAMIGKLKHELNYLKEHSNGKSTAGNDHNTDMLDDISSTSSSSSPSLEDTYHEHRLLISDLQRQLEELDGEASVTRERNRVVEKELQRLRLLESMTRSSNTDFQHLVEPVIEEYEKSVAKLESQLSSTVATLEEQQDKIGQLERLIRTQEQTISELRVRLSKVSEREQSNDSYIQELESKLMKSASETTKDQDMLNTLKNRIMKLKETDENTEQYISNLEQRLAAGDAERVRLETALQDLEAKVGANVQPVKRLSKSAPDTSTEKLVLKQLDEVNAKYKALEGERDSLQLEIGQLQEEIRRTSHHSVAEPIHLDDTIHSNGPLQDPPRVGSKRSSAPLSTNGKILRNRKSFADETETASSVAALSLLQAEIRLKEEMDRANRLQLTLDRLQGDHKETTTELNQVLQRYHETSEQLDFMERESCLLANAHSHELPGVRTSLDLSKEIAQANKDEQVKLGFANQIQDLEHHIQSLAKKMAIKDSELDIANGSIQKLEHNLAVAHEQITTLKQMGAAVDVSDETLKESLLASEKKQSLHWKLAHGELQKDMEKLALDLDGKEQHICQLEQEAKDTTHLVSQLDESKQQSTCLEKRLAETLASLAVLKVAHDGLQKKLQSVENMGRLESNHAQELAAEINALNKESLEQALKDQAESNHAEQEKMLERVLQLTQQVDMSGTRVATLQHKLELAESNHQDALASHDADMATMKANFERELQESKLFQEQLLADHEYQVVEVSKDYESAIRELEDENVQLHKEIVSSEHSSQLHAEQTKQIHGQSLLLLQQAQAELDVQKAENVRLTAFIQQAHSLQRLDDGANRVEQQQQQLSKYEQSKHDGTKTAQQLLTTRDKNDDKHMQQLILERLRLDCSEKEAQMQQLQEENSEYSLLSCELEKEINRMTHQIDDLQSSQQLVHQLLALYKINDPHQLVDTMSDSVLELTRCRQQISQMVHREDMLKMQDTLNDETKKYAQAERARLKLEKQMEALLSKKKLACF